MGPQTDLGRTLLNKKSQSPSKKQVDSSNDKIYIKDNISTVSYEDEFSQKSFTLEKKKSVFSEK